MRMRNDPKAPEKLKNSGYLVENYPYKLENDTIVELGMGKGEMITQLALENPSKNYVGVEKFATVAAKAAKKATELDLKNFEIVCDDIIKLPEIFNGSVDELWLTFSDPWPKARHEKRRLTYKTFLDIYKKVLNKNGVLKFKTDNDKLFEYSVESFKENGWKIREITRDFHNHKTSKNNVMTGYEEKWSSKGKNINYLEAVQ